MFHISVSIFVAFFSWWLAWYAWYYNPIELGRHMKLRNKTSFFQMSLSNHDHFDGLAYMIQQPNVGGHITVTEISYCVWRAPSCLWSYQSIVCCEGQITWLAWGLMWFEGIGTKGPFNNITTSRPAFPLKFWSVPNQCCVVISFTRIYPPVMSKAYPLP
jgi:hypothetical protein